MCHDGGEGQLLLVSEWKRTNSRKTTDFAFPLLDKGLTKFGILTFPQHPLSDFLADSSQRDYTTGRASPSTERSRRRMR